MFELFLQEVNNLIFFPFLNSSANNFLILLEAKHILLLILFGVPHHAHHTGVPGIISFLNNLLLRNLFLLDQQALPLKLFQDAPKGHRFHSINCCNGLKVLEVYVDLVFLSYDVFD